MISNRGPAGMRALPLLAAAAVATLFACGGERDSRSELARWDQALPIVAPWLRGQLPDGIRTYYRIPHPLGLLAMPKGNALDGALANAQNMSAFVAIQRGLYAEVLGRIPGIDATGLRPLIEALKSPIEIAAFGLPNPSGLVAATLDIDSYEAFERMFAGFAQFEPPLALESGLDDAGVGRIVGLPTDAFVEFEPATGQVLVQAFGSITETGFVNLTRRLSDRSDHPMFALERQIDASGHGSFGWVDLGALLPAAGMFVPPELTQTIARFGLDAARALAFGIGVADRKGRLSVLLDVGTGNAARPFPVVANAAMPTSVGEPDGLVLLSVPSASEFARLESLVLAAVPAAAQAQWAQVKDLVREYLGMGIEDVLSAIGPELVLIFDAAGDYMALRLRDPARFDALIASVGERLGGTLEQQQISGQTFYHWSTPSVDALTLASAPEPNALTELLARLREHWHWIRGGEFLYVASVPQPLIDRVRAGAGTDVGAWLTATQRLDVSSSLFAATAPVAKMPRRIYYLYLQAMQELADVANVDYDIWSMPTASELDLPAQGSVGFRLNLGEPYVSLELSFESNPLELLFGGSTASSIAVVGILAAIAIPAYQDYALRARVAVGLAAAQPTQAAVAEFYQSNGRFPDGDAALALDRRDVGPGIESITVEFGSGTVIVTYLPDGAPGGGDLWLEPSVEPDGTITWRCGSSIDAQYLPASCR